MPVNCPKHGVLLYGRRCVGCDCERADAQPLSDGDGRVRIKHLGGRRFVVVPRDPNERPDVPLRVPSHYCLDCKQRNVPCFECEPILSWPMLGTQDGFHMGQCDHHGRLMVICPRRGLPVGPPASIAGNRAAAEIRQLPDPFQTGPERARTHQQPGDVPLDPVHHQRMKECGAAVTIALAVGFLGGVGITLATFAWINHAYPPSIELPQKP